MQILIENGFMQTLDGGWSCKRLLAYVVEDEVKVRKHNDCNEWEIVHSNDPEHLQKLLDEMFKYTEKEQARLMDYADDISEVCNVNAFPVRFVQHAGKVEFFYNGPQTYITDPLFLFYIDLNSADALYFSTPECVVFAEDNPLETELLEIFEVMKDETDIHHSQKGVNLRNRVFAFHKTNVYANMTHALHDCLTYGVSNIGHQVAQIQVEDAHHTHLIAHILGEVNLPVIHAFAVSFLSEDFNGPINKTPCSIPSIGMACFKVVECKS